jgi:DNA-binding transcriptional LysR family regulator
MEDHRLRAFCLVVEMKSFSRAAEAKFMTQSAMSHLIKSLENELGIKLLSRQGKAVIATPAGKIFYEQARQILEQYKRMEQDIYSLMQMIKGPLSVGASTTAATYLLPQVFYNFSRAYPEVQIKLSVSNAEMISGDLFEGKIDIGVIEGKKNRPNISFEEVAEDEIVIIASDDNPLTTKQPLSIDDLVSQPFIMPEANSGMREFIDDFLFSRNIDPKDLKIAMTLDNTELIVQMVQSGIGISFVSKWSVFRSIKEGTIKILNVSGKRLHRKFYLIARDKESLSMAAGTFHEFVKGYRFFMPF